MNNRSLTIRLDEELEQGLEDACADTGLLIRHRGDKPQAERLEQWLAEVLQTYSDRLLHLDGDNFASCGVRLLNPYQAC